MIKNKPFYILLLLFFIYGSLFSQEKSTGPILEEYGAVWNIPNPTYSTPTNKEYKVVFDIMNSPDSPSELNASIETAARFLNMHAQAGVPKENLKVALVIHNKASKDLLENSFYQKKYKVNNPNKGLINDLMKADVDIIFCGQSSLSRNIPITETIEGTKLALSAMTALIQLQREGYQLIKF
ncbi:DsrE family protein [Eudoraea sp.]|uniref:DsrE family protein n=1 Tax=Eudoraea sp. TaxID=1979955 RepID=UPI003C751D7F